MKRVDSQLSSIQTGPWFTGKATHFNMDMVLLIARLILAGVFAVAGVGKLMDIPGSIRATEGFGVPSRLARPIGVGLPFVELLAALLLIPVSTALAGAALCALLLCGFLAGMLNSLRKGEAPDCHCFGQIHSEPVGRNTIIRNVVLLALSVLVMAGGTTPGYSLISWLDGESTAVKVLAVAVAIALIGVAAQTWLIVHMLGQNGRILIKIDELEKRPVAAPAAAVAPQATAKVPAPAFAATGLIGEKVSLESLLAHKQQVLLIFSDPGCGPCTKLMPEIGAWQAEYADKLTIALVTRGSIDDAREKTKPHSIRNVAIEKDRAISKAYDASGTPSAVLIDAQGNLASKVVGGADAIRNLLKTAVQPAPQNGGATAKPARPAGPEPGSVAPDFSLTDSAGVETTLADLSGQDSVLLFWNPGCGFCKRLQPDLVTWSEQEGDRGARLVTVTSGTPEDAALMTFSDRVLMDSGFKTGRLFGASGTPSAIRVSSDGTIGSQLVVGGPAIMSLLNEMAPNKAAK